MQELSPWVVLFSATSTLVSLCLWKWTESEAATHSSTVSFFSYIAFADLLPNLKTLSEYGVEAESVFGLSLAI